MTRGSDSDVSFTSSPQAVEVTFMTGSSSIATGRITVDRRKTFTAAFFDGTGATREVFLNTRLADEDVAASAGNHLAGGLGRGCGRRGQRCDPGTCAEPGAYQL
ncbi:MAG: hypothetical protein AAGC92_13655 [Pseudomonadota bacterium]